MLTSLLTLIQHHYETGLDDYWLPAMIKCSNAGIPVGRVKNGDVLIFACRRGEREIQLTEAFVDPDFAHFRRKYLADLAFFPMIEYHSRFAKHPALFPVLKPPEPLGEALARQGLKQLRIAESEKMAHVTYYFNGRREQPYPGEDWICIPSVKTGLQHHPQMRTVQIADTLVQSHCTQGYRFALANFAAGDVFGHFPDFQAQVSCVETIDSAVGTITGFCKEYGYCLIITADHGLLEQAYLPDGSWSLGHTQAYVPLILFDPQAVGSIETLAEIGSLADVAPTILHLLGIRPPSVMTGRSLFRPYITAARGVILLILDGFGIGVEDPEINPISAAKTPNLDCLFANYPHAALEASGTYVGLAPHSSGNSEAGHLTLGAGRVVMQDEVRIPARITPENLKQNQAFYRRIRTLISGQAVHILFLLSPEVPTGVLMKLSSCLKC